MRDNQGMAIDSDVFAGSCRRQKCGFLEDRGNSAVCGNLHCFLSTWYLARYKNEGHHWEDMHFNTQRGCLCFEDMKIYGCCLVREKPGSACSRVADVFPSPDSGVKFYDFIK